MSKGIIMEKHRKYSIVMTQDGKFQKVKPVKNADVGAEVSYEVLATNKGGLIFFQNKKGSSMTNRYIAIACMIMLFTLPFFFLGGQDKTYAYVNVDINPSLEMEIDEELRVVSISPLNADAERLIKQLSNYHDKKIEQVIELIMMKSDELGLIKNGKNILVGVSYVSNQDISVLDTVDNYFLTNNSSWEIATFQVPEEVRERAMKNDISMNKVMASSMNSATSNNKLSITQTRVNDDEKELIQSFYTNATSDHQNQNPNKDVIAEVDSKTTIQQPKSGNKKPELHPSDLKGQNGAIHSNGKNQQNKSKEAKERGNAQKEHKDKQHKTKKAKHAEKAEKHKHKKDKHHKKHQNKHKHNHHKDNKGDKHKNKHKHKHKE